MIWNVKPRFAPPVIRSRTKMIGGQQRDDLEHEHDRILDQDPRVELGECRSDCRNDDLGVQQGRYRHPLAKGGSFHGATPK